MKYRRLFRYLLPLAYGILLMSAMIFMNVVRGEDIRWAVDAVSGIVLAIVCVTMQKN